MRRYGLGTGQVGRLQLGWSEQVRAEQGERFCPDKMKQLISSLSCLLGLLCGLAGAVTRQGRCGLAFLIFLSFSIAPAGPVAQSVERWTPYGGSIRPGVKSPGFEARRRPMFIEHPGGYGCGWWQAVTSRSQR